MQIRRSGSYAGIGPGADGVCLAGQLRHTTDIRPLDEHRACPLLSSDRSPALCCASLLLYQRVVCQRSDCGRSAKVLPDYAECNVFSWPWRAG